MSLDLTIIAIVFTIILLLVFFSAVILYLSFRIKETFKKTNRTAKIIQTAFLIGILFLAGAILYYSAATLTNPNQPTPTPTPNPSQQPTPTNPNNNPNNTPIPSTTTQPNPTPTNNPNQPTPTPPPTPTQTPTLGQPITFSAFYPSSTTLDSQITLTFTAINPTSTTYKNAVIQTNTLLQSFTVISSTKPINANIVNIGDLPPGTTTVTLILQAPNRPDTFTDNATLIYQGIQNPPTQQITITIRGR
jgi:hypothetical protein